MNKMTFTGTVYPACVEVNYPRSPRVRFPNDEITNDIFLEMQIFKSIITINIEVDKYDSSMIGAIYKRAYDFTSSILNIIAFQKGLGLSFILEKYIIDNGPSTEVLIQDKSLEKLVTCLKDSESTNSVYMHILQNTVIARALDDLVACLKSPHVLPVNCARVIEAISNSLGKTTDKDKNWKIMRDKLNLSKEYTLFITNISKKPRHGNDFLFLQMIRKSYNKDRGVLWIDILSLLLTVRKSLMRRNFQYYARPNARFNLTQGIVMVPA